MIFQNFINASYSVQSINADDEDCVNLIPERLESDGGKTQQMLNGIPGVTAAVTGLAGPFTGGDLFAQDGRCFAIAGNTFYEVFDTSPMTVIARGTLLTDGNPRTIHSNGLGGNQLLVISGKSGYIYSLTANTLTLIVDVDFPNGNCAMGEFWQQYFFALPYTTNFFQISALSTGINWAATDKGVRSDTSDNLIAIIRLGSYMWLLGSRTSEPWQNTGAANFPFAPLVGAQMEYGVTGPWTATRVDNTIAFLGKDSLGARVVVQLAGIAPQRISNHAVEFALSGYTEASVVAAIGYAYQEAGHTFYVLTSKDWPCTWVYDFSTQVWHKRTRWIPTTATEEAQRAISHCYAFGKHLVGDRLTGTIYEQRIGIYTNGDEPIRWMRRAPHLCNEQKRTYHTRFQVDIEGGVGLTSGQGSDPGMSLRFSNDNGHTWSSATPLPMGKIGEYDRRSYTWRMGMARDRVYELSGMDQVKVCLVAAYINGQQGMA